MAQHNMFLFLTSEIGYIFYRLKTSTIHHCYLNYLELYFKMKFIFVNIRGFHKL